jgi:phosphatidylserine/phosphatidylglycerophosphate/cardiolipin synthase-like enzyme
MKFKKKNKIIIFLVLAFFLLAIFLAFVVRLFRQPFEKMIIPDPKPFAVISSDSPLQARFYFNDVLETEIFSEAIVKEINQATKSLEVAVYSLKSDKIKQAIIAASNRGVTVTLILDFRKAEIHDQSLADLPKEIRRLDLGSEERGKTILMHHKFALIDRGEKNEVLIFGSYNWTALQEKYDPSFLMISTEKNLVASFGREFDRLSRREAGPAKLKDHKYYPWDLNLSANGYSYEVWFGPGWSNNGINWKIKSLIQSAQSEIKIMIWDFTDFSLAQEIITKAQAGVRVKIISDDRNMNNPNSVFAYLKKEQESKKINNLEIISDANRNQELIGKDGLEGIEPFLHHHLLLVDGQRILFGTNNWSKAGSYYNDESAIVTDDPVIITNFNQSFEANYRDNSK